MRLSIAAPIANWRFTARLQRLQRRESLFHGTDHVLTYKVGTYRYSRCLISRPWKSLYKWHAEGPCSPAELAPSASFDGPVRVAFGFGEGIHGTHLIGQRRGLVWCWKCGTWSSGKKLQKLGAPCPRRPTTWGTKVLQRLRKGLTPEPKSEWPLSEEAAPREGILAFPSAAARRSAAAAACEKAPLAGRKRRAP